MKKNAIESYSGYIQIHKMGYWDDKNINNIFSIDHSKIEQLENDGRVKVLIPRLESFALASSGNATKGVAVMGISPEKENSMTNLKSFLKDGQYLNLNDNSILVASGLARFLNLKVKDTLVLFSSGYHGETAAGLFPVKGILEIPYPEMNRNTVYLPIRAAQSFFTTGNQFTNLIVDLNDIKDVEGVYKKITGSIDSKNFEVMDWKIMNKELLQMIASDNAGGIIMIAILYLVIAFGIFGTVLMMTNERMREFSVLISIGMQKWKLALVVIIELLFLTLIGVLAGILISLPLMFYYYYNPIEFTGEAVQAMKDFNFEPVMPMSLDVEIFIFQAIAILSRDLINYTYLLS
jgi:ABC-type lipoprotein release transport system permease subunit